MSKKSGPFFCSEYTMKIGHDFLGIQYRRNFCLTRAHSCFYALYNNKHIYIHSLYRFFCSQVAAFYLSYGAELKDT